VRIDGYFLSSSHKSIFYFRFKRFSFSNLIKILSLHIFFCIEVVQRKDLNDTKRFCPFWNTIFGRLLIVLAAPTFQHKTECVGCAFKQFESIHIHFQCGPSLFSGAKLAI
jgi:hypothetical protein